MMQTRLIRTDIANTGLKSLYDNAFNYYQEILGINFVKTSDRFADICITDNDRGAYAWAPRAHSNGFILTGSDHRLRGSDQSNQINIAPHGLIVIRQLMSMS